VEENAGHDQQPWGPPWVFLFGDFEADERTRELRVEGRSLAVERKCFDLLVCLLRRAGETLTKDELLATVWAGRIVTESTLTKAVMKLRAALGTHGQDWLRTVHGFGYRFTAQVERRPSAATLSDFTPSAGRPLPKRPHWTLVRALDAPRQGLVWLAEHAKTHEHRVFKFADRPEALLRLKREVTLYRLLNEALGGSAVMVQLHDWNFEEPPYFIEMEWIRGGDLANWLAADPPPPLDRRLEAIAKLADAVALVHGVGVLHKDLKPSNVLVCDDGSTIDVRLCDFGIGMLDDPTALDSYGITHLGFTSTSSNNENGAGTPLYLAPEVIAGRPPTLRSDLYALGVMLYQACVADNRRPLAPGWERDVADPLLREDIAALADFDPERRMGDAAALAQRLRCLPERRAQRAESERIAAAAEHAHVAQRRRNTALALCGILLVAFATTGMLYLRSEAALAAVERERQRADEFAARAEAVSGFLTEDLLALADPSIAGTYEVSLRDAVMFARNNLSQRFSDQPDIHAAVKLRIGLGMLGMRDIEPARAELEEALSITLDPTLGTDLMLALASLADVEDKPDAATEWAKKALAVVPDYDNVRRIRIHAVIAWQQYRNGQYVEARDQFEDLLAQAAREPGETAGLQEYLRLRIATACLELGENERARQLREEVVISRRQRLGDGHPDTLTAQRELGQVLTRIERTEEAIALLRPALEYAAKALGPDHTETLRTKNELATALMYDKQHAEALPLFQSLVDTRLARLGERHRDTRTSMNNLGMILNLNDRPADALVWYQRAFDSELAVLGENHPDTLILRHNLARTMRQAGRRDEAEAMQRLNVEHAKKLLPEGNWQTAIYMATLAETLEARGAIPEALSLAETAYAIMEATYGAEHRRSLHARQILDRLVASR